MWILIGLLEEYFSASHWKGVFSLVLGGTLPPYHFSRSEFAWSQLWWQNNRIICTCSNIIWCIFHSLLWHSHAGELCMATSSTSVQFSCSVVSDSLWPHELLHARLPCPSPTLEACSNSCPSSWKCHPINSSSVIPFSSCLQSFPGQGLFQWVSSSIRWPKYWSFSFSISPPNEYSRLISFRIDWFDLLEIQGTLKSLLQHHSWKASILQCSAFFTVQLSHPYMTTGKTIALTRQTFVGKVILLGYMSLSGFMLHLGCTASILIYMCIHINL